MRKAQNDINHKALSQDYASLNDFYYMVGLENTKNGGQLGWRSGRQMDLKFSAVMTKDEDRALRLSITTKIR